MDHVLPHCTYPGSLAQSNIPRITVIACSCCNNSFSDDETHFRNIIPFCGLDPGPLIQELFETGVLHSLDEVDGERRRVDLLKIIRPGSDGRMRVWPEEDERFMRILRKIVRGLCRHHNLDWPVSEARVHVEKLIYPVPPGYLDPLPGGRTDGDMFRWGYIQPSEDGPDKLTWILVIRSNMEFIARVAPPTTDAVAG